MFREITQEQRNRRFYNEAINHSDVGKKTKQNKTKHLFTKLVKAEAKMKDVWNHWKGEKYTKRSMNNFLLSFAMKERKII